MSTLLNVQEIIERAAYSAIRDVVLEHGYCPDIADYANTSAGQSAYNTEMAAIKTSKGFAIEVFGTSAPSAKGDIKVARIVVDTLRAFQGTVGEDFGRNYEIKFGTSDYVAHTYNGTRESIQIQFSCISNTIAQDRICNAIIFAALKQRGWIALTGIEQTQAFYEHIYTERDHELDKGLIISDHVYEFRDIIMSAPVLGEDIIVPISQITFEYFTNYLNDQDEYEDTATDTIVIS